MNFLRSVLILATALAIGIFAFGRGTRNASHEQTEFSAEDEGVKKPVTLPKDVMTLLRQDDRVRNVLENEDPPAEKLPPSWFSASIVHLAGPAEEDFVIMGEGEMRGANVIMFWIFRNTAHGHELVLTAPAHDLIVKKSRSNGYRDIEMLAATAVQFHTVILKFDGHQYRVHRDKWEPIR